jgi:TrkA domain protein
MGQDGGMAEVRETMLPGVGVRHEFNIASGERVAVLTHRGGRREIAVSDRADPDVSHTVLHLSVDVTRTLNEVLGANQVSEAVLAVQQQVEGLTIEWLTVDAASPAAGATIAEGAYRTRTGTSIVAIVRRDTTVPAPPPDARLLAGDVVVAVGTPDGLSELRVLLQQ